MEAIGRIMNICEFSINTAKMQLLLWHWLMLHEGCQKKKSGRDSKFTGHLMQINVCPDQISSRAKQI